MPSRDSNKVRLLLLSFSGGRLSYESSVQTFQNHPSSIYIWVKSDQFLKVLDFFISVFNLALSAFATFSTQFKPKGLSAGISSIGGAHSCPLSKETGSDSQQMDQMKDLVLQRREMKLNMRNTENMSENRRDSGGEKMYDIVKNMPRGLKGAAVEGRSDESLCFFPRMCFPVSYLFAFWTCSVSSALWRQSMD